MFHVRARRLGALVLLLLAAPFSAVTAQNTYLKPPAVVQRVLDAPRLPALYPSPDGKRLVLAAGEGLPSVADLAQPMLRLAGLRLNPQTNGRFTFRESASLLIRDVATGAEHPVTTPEGASLHVLDWSPDGSQVAFTVTTDSGIALWLADGATGAARALTPPDLNATMGEPCSWMPSGTALLCRFVPADRGAPPAEPRVPAGPIVRSSSGKAAPTRTFEDMLESPHDADLFAYYATSQLALVDTAGARTDVGKPAIFLQSAPAPGGALILVTRVNRPFSYLVPVWGFPRTIEIWNLRGQRVVSVATLPASEDVPVGGVPTGPRNVAWAATEPATLVYVEALDGGDNRRPAQYRDRVVAFAAPFTAPTELGRLTERYAGIEWGRDGLALLSEYDRSTRHFRTWALDTRDPGGRWRIELEYSREDRYHDPGRPVLMRDSAGQPVLLQTRDGKSIYLTGAGASPSGEHPFLDRLNLEKRRTQRVWQCDSTSYESVVAVLDPDARQIVTRAESRTSPPNYVFRDLRSGRIQPITHLTNPAPELATVRRELITYKRADGVQLSGTLYFPTDYQPGTKVPVIFWIYPSEFASAAAASQVRGSPNRFVMPNRASPLFLLTQGYAVLYNPTLPVLGGDTANNTYVEQTVAGAKAAVDYLMAQGIADGNFGVGGHSYGAFATANLLAHSDLFKAGVAESGAYNRTLTPFGFQNERRTFWEDTALYLRMMPFTYADSINEPILLIHGMADNNSGTFPIQSERMFMALKGLGATVEYVQLPYEAHGYAAKENIEDVIAREIAWFDRYVKGKPAGATGS